MTGLEKFSDAGGSAGRITTARICGDALLTGVRLSGQETLVDGMEGLKGEWRPFEVKIDQGFKEFKVKKARARQPATMRTSSVSPTSSCGRRGMRNRP